MVVMMSLSLSLSDSDSDSGDSLMLLTLRPSTINKDNMPKQKQQKCKAKKHYETEKLLLQLEHRTAVATPGKYDGTPDAIVFLRWKCILMQWFRMSYIHKKNRVMHASAFLEGRALSFYTIHVRSKAREWLTNKFFIKLFDFCFPSNW